MAGIIISEQEGHIIDAYWVPSDVEATFLYSESQIREFAANGNSYWQEAVELADRKEYMYWRPCYRMPYIRLEGTPAWVYENWREYRERKEAHYQTQR